MPSPLHRALERLNTRSRTNTQRANIPDLDAACFELYEQAKQISRIFDSPNEQGETSAIQIIPHFEQLLHNALSDFHFENSTFAGCDFHFKIIAHNENLEAYKNSYIYDDETGKLYYIGADGHQEDIPYDPDFSEVIARLRQKKQNPIPLSTQEIQQNITNHTTHTPAFEQLKSKIMTWEPNSTNSEIQQIVKQTLLTVLTTLKIEQEQKESPFFREHKTEWERSFLTDFQAHLRSKTKLSEAINARAAVEQNLEEFLHTASQEHNANEYIEQNFDRAVNQLKIPDREINRIQGKFTKAGFSKIEFNATTHSERIIYDAAIANSGNTLFGHIQLHQSAQDTDDFAEYNSALQKNDTSNFRGRFLPQRSKPYIQYDRARLKLEATLAQATQALNQDQTRSTAEIQNLQREIGCAQAALSDIQVIHREPLDRLRLYNHTNDLKFAQKTLNAVIQPFAQIASSEEAHLASQYARAQHNLLQMVTQLQPTSPFKKYARDILKLTTQIASKTPIEVPLPELTKGLNCVINTIASASNPEISPTEKAQIALLCARQGTKIGENSKTSAGKKWGGLLGIIAGIGLIVASVAFGVATHGFGAPVTIAGVAIGWTLVTGTAGVISTAIGAGFFAKRKPPAIQLQEQLQEVAKLATPKINDINDINAETIEPAEDTSPTPSRPSSN